MARWISERRRREILKISDVHFAKVFDVVIKLNEMVKLFKEGGASFKAIYKDVFEIEREADKVKEEIIGELSKGVIHPMDREDIVRLILSNDDVAGYAKTAARCLLYLSPDDVPEDIVENIHKMSETAVKQMSHLRRSFESLMVDPKKAIEEANIVERYEEAIDEIRDDLILRILKWADQHKVISLAMLVKELVERIEQMSDKMEDTGDVIRSLALSY